ncbi:hypothetical protein B0H11DRAFT_1920375 [Mycena galericulata]|nr:hypothetical protein B0H11DRAFT_1920375 [Mycena galericulata]
MLVLELFHGCTPLHRFTGSVRLETRDIIDTSFMATQVSLKNAANVFAQDIYVGSGVAPNVTALEAEHIKNCSDAFDAAVIELYTINGPLSNVKSLSLEDAEILNTTYVPSTQTAIISTLSSLQTSEGFSEAVNGTPILLVMFCRWVGLLAEENAYFLDQLAGWAPYQYPAYSEYWGSLQATAAAAHQNFLTEDGLICSGLY